MLLAFRTVVVNKNVLKSALNINFTSGNCCRCKVLTSFQKKYSTASQQESNVNKSVENELIYTGLLSKNIRKIKIFSLSTTILGIACQPIVYTKAVAAGTASNLTLPAFAAIGIFAIATPLLLNIITKRYVIDMEYNAKEDKYIASVYNIFAMKKKIEFTPEDVTIPAVLGMFANCKIKGKPIFLDMDSFTEVEHYGRIMGYDKPLDLKVDEDQENASSKKN